jgi:PAS domain S-box-containing protein
MPKARPSLWSEPSAIARYAIAVLSVAIAIVVADLLTRWLHTEPIASSMLCAVIFAAWFGFGPGLLAIALSLLAFHYYLVPPVNSFAFKQNLFAVGVSELPRLALFAITSLFVNFISAAQRSAKDAALQAEAKAARVEREIRLLADTIPALVWRALPDGAVEYFNQRWLTYTGLPLEQARGWGFIDAYHPDDRVSVRKLTSGGISGPPSADDLTTEARLRGADGKYRWFLGRAMALRDDAGNVIRWYGTSIDIEDRKRAEEALHAAQAELAQVTRLTTLGEVGASIAHEVNQPLASVVAHAEACLRWLDRETPELDEARNAAESIVKDGKRAGEVIRRVRALANKTDTQKAPLDLNDVVHEVIALVQRKLASRRVSLRTELAQVLPLVLADRVQMQQVMINLVINGIEAMEGVTDRPRVLVIRSSQDEADQVSIAVKDSGVGIAAEDADRLFGAFVTTKSSGMGMGLSICRRIIQAHGGRIWFEPNPTGGAAFRFTLPVHRAEAF